MHEHAAACALDAVGSGLVHGFAGGNIALDLLLGKLIERHVGHIDKRQALGGMRSCSVAGFNDADAGRHLVRAARKLAEHGARLVLVCRLTQNHAIEGDDGIGRDGQFVGLGMLGRDGSSFGTRQALDERKRSFAIKRRFIDVCGNYANVIARLAHQLYAARRLRSQNHSWMPSATFSTAFSPASVRSSSKAKGSDCAMPLAVMILPSCVTFSPV